MKHALKELEELILLGEDIEVQITSNIDSDVLIGSYKIGNEYWLTIVEDCDIHDDYESNDDNHKRFVGRVNINGNTLKKLKEVLNRIA